MFNSVPHTQIEAAAERLRAGGVVALPTETVYGLAADASNPAAVKRIFEIKGRPADHPLIVHIGDVSQLRHWARDIPATAYLLAQHFWPGPLTLILPRQAHVSDVVTGGQDSIGLRVPKHPLALAVLRVMGEAAGLAAPSANRYGRISPTTAKHVYDELGETVDMILDGGACEVGLESTIVSCLGQEVALLRPGGVPRASLEKVLGYTIQVVDSATASVRVSGNKLSHYAPLTPLEMASRADLKQRLDSLLAQGLRVATLEWSATDDVRNQNKLNSVQSNSVRHLMPNDAVAYAQQLYASLRQLDEGHFDRLLAEAPPGDASWLAVADRLQRASYRT
jgi:L-threonylcarbamoyladenylate synthase